MVIKEEKGPEIESDYFWLPKQVLKLGGVRIMPGGNILYRVYAGLVLSLFVSLTLEELYSIVVFFREIDKMANLISVWFSHIAGLIKVFILLKNRALISKALDKLHQGYFIPNPQRGGEMESLLIKECIADTRRQAFVYYIAGACTILNADALALKSKLKEADYTAWEEPWVAFGLFEVSTTLRYYVVYAYQFIVILMFGFVIMSTDLVIIRVFTHIRAHFYILGNFIRISADNLEVNKNENADPTKVVNRELQKRSKQAVAYHQAIIDLSEMFEELFNVVVLLVFIANVVVLCFTMYLGTLWHSLSDPRTLMVFTYFITITSQVFMYCYYGNEIALASVSISDACYDAKFVGTNLSYQKDLLMIMQRSQKPVIHTIGKFGNLTLTAFVSIMRASYSYFMLLNQTNKK